MNMVIREVNPEDAGRLLEIYSYYIENTAITFEVVVPTVEEFKNRIIQISANYPYFVAEVDGRVVGYIYASRYRARAAYDWCAESSIYIDKDYQRMGIGKLLYEELEAVLLKQNIVNLYAGIAVPVEEEDEYLNFNSLRFHEKIGYKRFATFEACGNKYGRWYSLTYASKVLYPHRCPPEKFIPYHELEV